MDWNLQPVFVGLCVFAASSLLPSAAIAQEGGSLQVRWVYEGEDSLDYLGRSVAGLGDINGDGYGDFIIGAPGTDSFGLQYTGTARVISGLDGTDLYTVLGVAEDMATGESVANAGDVNADGVNDFMIGHPGVWVNGVAGAGMISVRSGATGFVIFEKLGDELGALFGERVAGAGDVNGDGYDDIIVGEPHADSLLFQEAGAAHVFSGRTGDLIYPNHGSDHFVYFGNVVAGVGDLNGDGNDDFLIGEESTVNLYSGFDGSVMYSLTSSYYAYGSAAAGAGDVNGDGFDDFIIGNYFLDEVYVHSGLDGQLLYQLSPQSFFSMDFGRAVAGAGDVNGDGFPDIAVSAPTATNNGIGLSGSVYLYSGYTGDFITRIDGPEFEADLGQSLAIAPDINNDGYDDLIIGTTWTTNTAGDSNAGSVFVTTFDPGMTANVNEISAAAGGQVNLAINFSADAGGYLYVVLMSVSPVGSFHQGVTIPLTLDSMVQQTAAGNYPFSGSNLHGTLDPTGNALATIQIPAGAYSAFVGMSGRLAAVAYPSGGLPEYSSAATTITIVP